MRRRHLIALTFALALIATAMQGTAPARAAGPSITEFPIAGAANPDQIAPGLAGDPSASVWVTDPFGGTGSAGQVFRVDVATGDATGTFAPPTGATVPTFIIHGPDGRMWTTDFDGSMLRAGSDGAFTAVTPTGGARGGVTTGPDGNVWYLNNSGGANNGQVGFVDPATLASSRFDIPTANSHPEEITPGPPSDPNSLWFTEQSADRIGRVDTITHQVTDFGGLSAGAEPNGIVAASDGALWFAEYGIGKIGRIDPATDHVTEYDVPGAGGPDRMTVAADGRIWFTLFDSSQVGSFVPGPNPTFELISTPTPGAGPSGITIGPDGHVWFAEYNNHAVARIDGSPSGLPTTMIDSGPSGTISDTSATFTFHADDPAATFQCSLDGGAFTACTSPETIPGLAAGQHTFTVRAVNAAGTELNPPSRTFSVQPTPPPQQPPVNTGLPAIKQAQDCSGVSSTLSGACKPIANTYDCDPGTWTGQDPAIPFTYEWQRLTPIYVGGQLAYYKTDTVATGQRYYAQSSELKQVAATESWLFQCAVTASNAAGRTSATSPTGQLEPAPATPALESSVNIRVTGIEVTQGAQTICTPCAPSTLPRRTDGPNPTSEAVVNYQGQGVTLAAGKLAVVRVFAGYSAPLPGPPLEDATATLRVSDSQGNLIATWAPDSYAKSVPWDSCLCVGLAQRANPGASFNFEIPWQETLHQKLTFEATVNPPVGFGQPKQCFGCHANTFKLVGVPFLAPARVEIHPIPLTVAGVKTSKTETQVFGTAQTVLPNNVQIFPYEASLPVDGKDNAGAAAAVLERGTNVDKYNATQYPIGVFFNGEGKLANGLTPSANPLYTQMPYSIVQDDRPLTSVTHEIGHGLGLVHAGNECGGGQDGDSDDYATDSNGNVIKDNNGNPVSNGQVGEPWSPDNQGQIQSVGLDIRNWNLLQTGSLPQTVVAGFDHTGGYAGSTKYYDFMSYCPNGDGGGSVSETLDWISTTNWNRLLAFQLPTQALPPAADTARAATSGPQLRVIATIDGSGTASIFDVTPEQGPAIAPTPGSSYRVELRDAAGSVLASVAADVHTIHVDGQSGLPPLILQASLPFASAAAAVVLTNAGQELARRDRSATPPTAELVSPRTGSTIGRGATTPVRWIEHDADHDPLLAAVDYSADGGRTWKVVADRVTTSSALVPSRLLSASRNGRLRVRVSDGFDFTTAQSGRLRSVGRPPLVRILGPGRGGRIRAGTPLLLQGVAFDDAGRPLAGRQLSWYAGRRLLAHGATLEATRLAPGATTIRLVATDRSGRSSKETLRLDVLSTPPVLTVAKAPTRVSPNARRVRLVVASNVPATLSIAGTHHRVDRKLRAITIRISPGLTTLRIRYTLSAPGGTVHLTYTLVR